MITADNLEFVLWLGTTNVGRIRDAFCTDMNGYGIFELSDSLAEPEPGKRVAKFVKFCIDWHSRLGSKSPPAVEEFDVFNDIIKSGLWVTEGAQGKKQEIETPVFSDQDVCWRIKGT